MSRPGSRSSSKQDTHWRHLDARSKQELLGLIEDYRNGLVPLVVPLTLIRHHVERCDIAYLRDQHYLAPHPVELMLRNRV